MDGRYTAASDVRRLIIPTSATPSAAPLRLNINYAPKTNSASTIQGQMKYDRAGDV